jgi:hypothetical protein
LPNVLFPPPYLLEFPPDGRPVPAPFDGCPDIPLLDGRPEPVPPEECPEFPPWDALPDDELAGLLGIDADLCLSSAMRLIERAIMKISVKKAVHNG